MDEAGDRIASLQQTNSYFARRAARDRLAMLRISEIAGVVVFERVIVLTKVVRLAPTIIFNILVAIHAVDQRDGNLNEALDSLALKARKQLGNCWP